MDLDSIKFISFILIIVFGIIGNIINIKIFSNKYMHRTSSFKYLLFLSLIDLIFLSTTCANSLLTIAYSIDIRLLSSFLCKFGTFLSNWSIQIASWTLMLANVNMSLKIINRNTNRKKPNITILILIFMIFLIAFLNIHYLILMNRNETIMRLNHSTSIDRNKIIINLNKNSSLDQLNRIINKLNNNKNKGDVNLVEIEQKFIKYECKPEVGSKYEYFLEIPWSWISTLFFALIPFISNTFLFISVSNSLKKSKYKKLMVDNDFKKFILISNLVFGLFSFPFYFNLVYFHMKPFQMESSRYETMAHLFFYLKHSVSFLMYFFTFKRFRLIFLSILFPRLKNETDHSLENMIKKNNRLDSINKIRIISENYETKMPFAQNVDKIKNQRFSSN
jgi:hypothetical protein